MAGFQITGTIAFIGDTQQVSDKFTKRLLAVQVVDGNFTETPSFEFVQDRVDLLDNFAEGQEVVVDFNVRGREYQPKTGGRGFFTSLQGWKITAAGAAQPATKAAPAKAISKAASIASDDEISDLPF
ncbi:DUF3127 domain-containing protein [Hymenobacter glacieicola]|uniref:DUF3127 domain-containing protein n=1 Tax=Hymenobacter glacieicola TaxID=1562124 RepID=A0ABQ1X661_9BACT|nr:DUF3127 domain-containing protein [Hymenobacter glacieicola]GGG61383.1 hypothetical protein GCM10011378_41790 [Hymenobacter glacieicola]